MSKELLGFKLLSTEDEIELKTSAEVEKTYVDEDGNSFKAMVTEYSSDGKKYPLGVVDWQNNVAPVGMLWVFQPNTHAAMGMVNIVNRKYYPGVNFDNTIFPVQDYDTLKILHDHYFPYVPWYKKFLNFVVAKFMKGMQSNKQLNTGRLISVILLR